MESTNPYPLLDVLHCHNVPFVVIGGQAVVVHGHLRSTADTDIVFLRTQTTEERLFQALHEVNAIWIGDELDPQTGIERTYAVTLSYVSATRLMMLDTDLGFLDVFDYVPGCPSASVDELMADAITHQGHKFASLVWLRRMKQATNRPQDIADLEHLSED